MGTFAMLMYCVTQRMVYAMLAGPPCESWSVARWHVLPNMKYQPKPLRSVEIPWAVHCIAERHMLQVHVANRLMWTTLALAKEMIQLRRVVIIEHPAPAAWHPDHVSIWKAE